MINVGIIGLGFMGATHINAYRQIAGVRVAAICSPSGRHLDGDFSDVSGNVGSKEPIKLDMHSVKASRDANELFSDPDIDLIDICTPTFAHAAQCIGALQADKHVICEKPLARTAKLAQTIAAAAESAKGYFMPAMCMRFWPEWAWLKQVIDQQTYGKILAARFRRVAEPPAWGQKNFFDGQQSGGALFDLHVHDVDFVQFCFGRPQGVFSSGFTKVSGAIDHVVTQYQVASGAAVHAEGSWAMTAGFGFHMSYTAVFENATADYDLARGADALKLFEKDRPPATVTCHAPDGYVGELSHMIEAIKNQKPPTIVTARDGQSAVEICEAEEQSIRLRKPIFL
ncbi:MAG TPA: Gfo/Idh/MocA family oxidoreductase [Candidatus Eisenbacteria bacterium]|jgi:predicted dehydrogenase|nr:Gfo/Idh/MocA family oxidoreductase [Candidatus Eisenbacteria bacterium]